MCQRHLANLRKQSMAHGSISLCVCLTINGDKIPTYEVEKDEMFEAGLGEKLVEFDKLDMKAEEFCDVLYNVFPRL